MEQIANVFMVFSQNYHLVDIWKLLVSHPFYFGLEAGILAVGLYLITERTLKTINQQKYAKVSWRDSRIFLNNDGGVELCSYTVLAFAVVMWMFLGIYTQWPLIFSVGVIGLLIVPLLFVLLVYRQLTAWIKHYYLK